MFNSENVQCQWLYVGSEVPNVGFTSCWKTNACCCSTCWSWQVALQGCTLTAATRTLKLSENVLLHLTEHKPTSAVKQFLVNGSKIIPCHWRVCAEERVSSTLLTSRSVVFLWHECCCDCWTQTTSREEGNKPCCLGVWCLALTAPAWSGILMLVWRNWN